jgi:hypothetical protein
MSADNLDNETDDEMWARRKALLNPTPADTDDQKSVRAHDPMAWLERKRAADERLV